MKSRYKIYIIPHSECLSLCGLVEFSVLIHLSINQSLYLSTCVSFHNTRGKKYQAAGATTVVSKTRPILHPHTYTERERERDR